jgi:pimeloyl-ACP methyl ester carboxylesterase
VHQLKLAPVSIVAHSLGGNIALRYAGLYPENVHRIVAIEGLGFSPKLQAQRDAMSLHELWHEWIDQKRALAGRSPRRYATLEEALARMKAENAYLSLEQARHLTAHGMSQNEDGTFSWKFDNYVRVFSPLDLPQAQIERLWNSITCPTLLCYGANSFASNPETDGRARHFRNARVVVFPDAGHWLHHDQFERFMAELRAFL